MGTSPGKEPAGTVFSENWFQAGTLPFDGTVSRNANLKLFLKNDAIMGKIVGEPELAWGERFRGMPVPLKLQPVTHA